MFRCGNGHEFSEAESRGRKIKEGLPFLICPFCGDEVPLDGVDFIMVSLREYEKRLDEITEKLEDAVSKLQKVLERKRATLAC
jgi:hypothetical protein